MYPSCTVSSQSVMLEKIEFEPDVCFPIMPEISFENVRLSISKDSKQVSFETSFESAIPQMKYRLFYRFSNFAFMILRRRTKENLI